MKCALAGLVCVGLCGSAVAEPQVVQSRVESVALFKNGLAVVRQTVDLPGSGQFLLDNLPAPVHGSFFVESVHPVVASATVREIPVDAPTGSPDLQRDLAGKTVTLHFREGSIPAVSGRVVRTERARTPAGRAPSVQPWQAYSSPTPAAGRYLILETERGRSYVDAAMVARVDVSGNDHAYTRPKPVLLLQTDENGPQTVAIHYLARGLAWAPSYRIDLLTSENLRIEQQAILKNEMGDLRDAEVHLISGFPAIEMGHVISPISMETNWTQFFAQLNRGPEQTHAMASNVISQQVAFPISNQPGIDLSATPMGEGVDLHYMPAGRVTLADGDAVSLRLGNAEAEYGRVVEWHMTDARRADGRIGQTDSADEAWDAIRFRNPFDHPMTTAPAMILSDGRFSGQRTSYWVNAGERTSIRVNKALSIRTRAIENEVADAQRETVHVGGWQYRKVQAQGELTIANHRNERIEAHIRRGFSGELISADGEPENLLRETGIYSVNRQNELYWTIPLDPGESRTLQYRYSVLVRH